MDIKVYCDRGRVNGSYRRTAGAGKALSLEMAGFVPRISSLTKTGNVSVATSQEGLLMHQVALPATQIIGNELSKKGITSIVFPFQPFYQSWQTEEAGLHEFLGTLLNNAKSYSSLPALFIDNKAIPQRFVWGNLETMRIAIASDHAGVSDVNGEGYKHDLIERLKSSVPTILDLGPNTNAPVNYPDFALKIALSVLHEEADAGILMCGTGAGISIGANRIRGIRAAVCRTPEDAEVTRKHNCSNVLCLGARITTDINDAMKIIDTWIRTCFSGDQRHKERIARLDGMITPFYA
jgi:ribose 5-phosphate isomerase B